MEVVGILLQSLLAHGGELIQCCELARDHYDSLTAALQAQAQTQDLVAPSTSTAPVETVDALVRRCVQVLGAHIFRALPELCPQSRHRAVPTVGSSGGECECEFESVLRSGLMARDPRTGMVGLDAEVHRALARAAHRPPSASVNKAQDNVMDMDMDLGHQRYLVTVLHAYEEFSSLQQSVFTYYKQLYLCELALCSK